MDNRNLLILGGIAALWLLQRQRTSTVPAAIPGAAAGGGGGGGGLIDATPALPTGLSESIVLVGGEVVTPTGSEPMGRNGSTNGVTIVSDADTPVTASDSAGEDIGVHPTNGLGAPGYQGMTGGDPPVIDLPPSTEPVSKQDANAIRLPAGPVPVRMGILIDEETGGASYTVVEEEEDSGLYEAIISDAPVRVMDRFYVDDLGDVQKEQTFGGEGFAVTPSVLDRYLSGPWLPPVRDQG